MKNLIIKSDSSLRGASATKQSPWSISSWEIATSRFTRLAMTSLILFLGLNTACSGSGGSVYSDTDNVAVDSTNSRLFITETGGKIFVRDAATREDIGGKQPFVSADKNSDISDLMPETVTQLAATNVGDSSRLFVMGAQVSDSGSTATNEIRVLDFDGTSFTEASFSPITISDGDDATDESNNTFADAVLDRDNGILWLSDASTNNLYGYSTADGTLSAGPIAIAGKARGLSYDNGKVFVCNASTDDADQVITVVNTSDLTTTQLDAGIPCDRIAAITNDNGTVLFIKNSAEQQALIMSADFGGNTLTAIASADTDETLDDGSLSSGAGITSSINDIVSTKDTSDNIIAYISEADGNIEAVTVSSDLSGYDHKALSTSALNINTGSVFTDADDFGTNVYFAAESGSLITIVIGDDAADVDG